MYSFLQYLSKIISCYEMKGLQPLVWSRALSFKFKERVLKYTHMETSFSTLATRSWRSGSQHRSSEQIGSTKIKGKASLLQKKSKRETVLSALLGRTKKLLITWLIVYMLERFLFLGAPVNKKKSAPATVAGPTIHFPSRLVHRSWLLLARRLAHVQLYRHRRHPPPCPLFHSSFPPRCGLVPSAQRANWANFNSQISSRPQAQGLGHSGPPQVGWRAPRRETSNCRLEPKPNATAVKRGDLTVFSEDMSTH
jgi:hypothetical protein